MIKRMLFVVFLSCGLVSQVCIAHHGFAHQIISAIRKASRHITAPRTINGLAVAYVAYRVGPSPVQNFFHWRQMKDSGSLYFQRDVLDIAAFGLIASLFKVKTNWSTVRNFSIVLAGSSALMPPQVSEWCADVPGLRKMVNAHEGMYERGIIHRLCHKASEGCEKLRRWLK